MSEWMIETVKLTKQFKMLVAVDSINLKIKTGDKVYAPTESALEIILERLEDTTFSLTCSFHHPHPPFVATETYTDMFPPEDMPVPESINDIPVRLGDIGIVNYISENEIEVSGGAEKS